MSEAETPVPTEAQQILAGLAEVKDLLGKLVTAINGLGQNQQWLVDNTQGIFQFFNSPQFMLMLQNVMSGQIPGMPPMDMTMPGGESIGG